MVYLRKMIIEHFAQSLRKAYQKNYSGLEPDIANVLCWAGEMAIEELTGSDALYHNYEHTIMVTLVGQEILRGKHLREGGVAPDDWFHFVMALLFHDIGFMKGICRDDKPGEYASGVAGKTVKLSADGSDAVLAPYHVDRSKLFVRERFGGKNLVNINVDKIANYIEMTRMPVPQDEAYQNTNDFAGLVRSAGSLALARARRQDGGGIDNLIITLEDVADALVEVKQ